MVSGANQAVEKRAVPDNELKYPAQQLIDVANDAKNIMRSL